MMSPLRSWNWEGAAPWGVRSGLRPWLGLVQASARCRGLDVPARAGSQAEGRSQCMLHHRIVSSITAALLSLVVTSCAGPATEDGVGRTDPAGVSSSATVLCGSWQGYFAHPGADY